MAWADFQESLVTSDDHIVMGRKLRPFCLEYQFWLEVIGSPLMTGIGAVTAMDLEIATLVCSADYKANKFLPDKKRDYEGFVKKISWGLKVAKTDMDKELALFDRYIRDYTSIPETTEDKKAETKDGKSYSSFPNVLSTAAWLIKNNFQCGVKKAVWMTPLGEAHWYAIAFWKLDGTDVGVKTDHDRDFEGSMEEFKKQLKQVEESGGFKTNAHGTVIIE